MNISRAIIATSISGIPELGSEITLKTKNGTIRTRRRALIGWTHQNDTIDGLVQGKLWCWVDGRNCFMIYDQTYNRSKIPGEVRFCGVANFTMVRMFHPFWCDGGHIPRDMVSSDKANCRDKYRERIRLFNIQYGFANSTEPEASTQANGINGLNAGDSDDENTQGTPSDRGRGRFSGRGRTRRPGRGRGRGRGAPRWPRRRRWATESNVTGSEESVAGSLSDDPMEISDEHSDNDDSPGITENETEIEDQQSPVERSTSRAIREESTVSILQRLMRDDDIEAQVEEMNQDGNEVADEAHREENMAPKNEQSVAKIEENQQLTGARNDPIEIVDDDDGDGDDADDDGNMFFPEVTNPNLNANTRRSSRNFSHEAESMIGVPTSMDNLDNSTTTESEVKDSTLR